MYGDQLLGSGLEFSVLSTALREQISRRQTVDQIMEGVESQDRTKTRGIHGTNLGSLSKPLVARIYGAARSYCLLWTAAQHDGTEPIAAFVVRLTDLPLAHVEAVFDVWRPVPYRPNPNACPRQHDGIRIREPLEVVECPTCDCLVCCSCSEDLLKSSSYYAIPLGQIDRCCRLCRQSKGDLRGQKKRINLETFYARYGRAILTEYVARVREYKTGFGVDQLLSQWTADMEQAGSVENTRETFVQIAQSRDFPNDPWFSFLIKGGIGFIPRCEKRKLLREAENCVRSAVGLHAIGEGWVSEMLLGSILREVCDRNGLRLEHHKRFGWLGRQHLDFYIPQLHMGFEFMGQQHYSPVRLFGGKAGLQKTRDRDRIKQELCAANGVSLTCVRFDEPISEDDFNQRVEARIQQSHR